MSLMTPRDSHIYKRDQHDFYLEEEWCNHRLFEKEKFCGNVVDPACGSGRILDAAKCAGYETVGSDIIDRGAAKSHAFNILDFRAAIYDASNIVSNPPFRHAREFAEIALNRAARKVALLLPASWLQGDERSRWLETTPLRRVWFLTPRPSMPPGEYVLSGGKVGGGTKDFAWFVWVHGYDAKPDIEWLRKNEEVT